jgi:seryl-tRNA synthetase
MNQQTNKAVTLKNGYWFFFDIEGHQIAANGVMSGKESVYVNDELVSKKWSFFGTKHYFKINNTDYLIDFEMASQFRGEVQCRLFKEGTLIATELKAFYNKDNKSNFWKVIFASFIVGFIFSFSTVFLIKWLS